MNTEITTAIGHPIFRIVSEEAAALGVSAYVVGGYVRDALLGRACKDVDIMSVGKGIDLATAVARRLKLEDRLVVYQNFGTALIQHDDLDIEFVGARKESYRANSRKPIVEDGSLTDDLSRRDFTINALAVSLNANHWGEIVDLFNGLADLQNGVLRTPLDADITYSDDPLRMMRGIRFAAQLQFQLESESLQAMYRNAERIHIISKERICDELHKIVLAPVPSVGFKLLFDTGILKHIFPEMVALHGVDVVDGKAHKDNFYHTLQVLDNLSRTTPKLWLRWSAIMHDIAKPPTKRFEPGHGWTFHGHEDLGARMTPGIFKRLGLPLNEKMKYVQKLVRLHLRPIALVKKEITDAAIRRLIFEAGEDLEDLMLLCQADITTKDSHKLQRYLRNFELVKQKIEEVEAKDHVRNFQPPISGEEIMQLFQIGPSREIGILKNALKDAILDGAIANNYDEALPFIIQKAKELGLSPVQK